MQYVGTVWAKSESTPGFRVAGKVRQRLVDPGARVDKGQVLMRLDQADLVLALNSARANRDRAEAEWRLAEVELERFRDLRDKRFVSETEFDRALLAERRAHALFEQADSELSLARNRLAYTELVATGDGTVTEVFVDVGDVVEAGAPVARIALDGARDFVVDVPESQRNWVSASPASITLWALGERRFNASLRELGAAADPVTRTYRARFSIEADEVLASAERALTSIAASEIEFSSPPYDLAYLQGLHHHLFRDIYAWAGEIRTIDISKSDTRFCRTDRIIPEATKIFAAMAQLKWFEGMARPDLIQAIAEYYGDLNMVHPFREGNGRAQRFLFEHLIVNVGYQISWAPVTEGEWLQANIDAVECDYAGLIELFEKCIGAPIAE